MHGTESLTWASSDFTPHGFCLAWRPWLLVLHVASDAAIAAAYLSIPLTLGWLVLRRKDLLFRSAFVLFAAFIVACGATHLMDIWTLWHADYFEQGLVKAVTAVISVLTAATLWPLLPQLLALPSPAAMAAEIGEKERALQALRQEITERQQAEAMLRHSQKLQAVGQLTGGVAHDFNNLLTVVQGNLEILQRRLPEETSVAVYLERSIRAVSRGAQLTQQLLAFARRQPLQPAAVDLNDRVSEMSQLLPRTVSDRACLTLELSPDLWLAEADAGQLDTALMNLAINAGHAMPHGGQLLIRTANVRLDPAQASGSGDDQEGAAEAGDYIMIMVEDTGIGMTPEVREKAFEPFFTTRPNGAGSGLGLSQVYGFVNQSRGRITLHSEVGRGTTVTLLLRRATADQAAGRPAAAVPPLPVRAASA